MPKSLMQKKEQLHMKVTASVFSSKTPPSNFTLQERKAVTSLSRDQNITIFPADEGRCTVVLNITTNNNIAE